MNDLLCCGIKEKNITVYDMHDCISFENIILYDVVYICGGNTEYLLGRINQTGFDTVLMKYIEQNGLIVGVSAGSLIFANNLTGNLGLINTKLDVHCESGDEIGKVKCPMKDTIRLTNKTALIIKEPSIMEIVGQTQ